jgi:uncharacterized protein involved in exopolysaccharide biosynthesis
MFAVSLDRLLMVWEQRGFVLKTTLVAAVAAAVLSLVMPKSYQSTTRLMPAAKGQNTLATLGKVLGDNLSALASEAAGMQSSGALVMQVLRSRTVQDHLIERFDLRHGGLMMNARAQLEAATEISEDRRSGVVTVAVTARSPDLAQKLARGYVEELNLLMAQLDTSAAHRERVFIEERLHEVKSDLDRNSLQLSQFSSANRTLDLKDQGKSMVEAMARLQGELIAAQSELQGIREIYGPENARVRAAEARVAELDGKLKDMQGGGTGDLGYPSIRTLPQVGLQYTELYRNVTIQEAVFENLTKQWELAKVEEARDLPSVRVLDEADKPERKSRPKRTLMVLAGMLLGLSFATGYVLLADVWRRAPDSAPLKRLAGRLQRDVLADLSRVPWLGRRVSRAKFQPDLSGGSAEREQAGKTDD